MEATIERGRRLGRKYTLMGFVTLAGGFVLWTSQQIIFAALGLDVSPLPSSGQTAIEPGSCEGELRSMTAAVDRAILASASAPDEARASVQYRAALAPEWSEDRGVQARCATTPHGEDAFAALLRLKVAGEEVARRHARELGPLRKDLAVYLPPGGLPR
jgi:hypothetical protein